jgi:hypothetical protein
MIVYNVSQKGLSSTKLDNFLHSLSMYLRFKPQIRNACMLCYFFLLFFYLLPTAHFLFSIHRATYFPVCCNRYVSSHKPQILHYLLKLRISFSQGENWQNFRSKVNQTMMQPKSTKLYVGPVDSVANDFLKR